MKQMFRRGKGKKGQTLVEYALILALITLLIISVLSLLGKQVSGTFSKLSSDITSAQGQTH
jgi:Flp pilus assembly pilin Flp